MVILDPCAIEPIRAKRSFTLHPKVAGPNYEDEIRSLLNNGGMKEDVCDPEDCLRFQLLPCKVVKVTEDFTRPIKEV